MKNKSYLLIILSILIISTVSIICFAILRQPKSDTTRDKESDTDLIIQDTEKTDDNNDNSYSEMMTLQDMISEFVKSKKFQKSNTEDRLKLTEEFMKELVEKKMIKDYKIDLSAGASKPNVLYYYNDENFDGAYGVIMITDFAKDQN